VSKNLSMGMDGSVGGRVVEIEDESCIASRARCEEASMRQSIKNLKKEDCFTWLPQDDEI